MVVQTPTLTGTITGFKTIKPHYGNRQRFLRKAVLYTTATTASVVGDYTIYNG